MRCKAHRPGQPQGGLVGGGRTSRCVDKALWVIVHHKLHVTTQYAQSVLPTSIFSSERSFAQFRLPDEEGRTAVGFGQQANTLLVIGSSGTFYVASFDMERGGPCEERHSCRFLELTTDL